MSKLEQANTFVVVSYWPLIDIDKPKIFDKDPANELQRFVEDTPEINVMGCAWILKDEEPIPVLIVDRAKEIQEHMLKWCEDDPLKWFKFCIQEVDNQYVLIIYPDVEHSIQRFRLACLHFHDFIPPENAQYKVIFSPIRFLCESNTAYQSIKDQLNDRILVGFLDAKSVDRNDPASMDLSKIVYLGPLERITEPSAAVSELMRQLIDNYRSRQQDDPDVLNNM